MSSKRGDGLEDGDQPRAGHPMQVAIDGPAGAGKSTVAKGVAKALGFIYVDTGAMYRAVALRVLRMTGPDAELDWGETARGVCLEFRQTPTGQHIFMDGEDVEEAIREPQVSDWSSRVSADPRVRRALTVQMQRMGRKVSVVMEGRDVGTVVMPDARLKVFLTAAPEERARRRTMELAAKGQTVPEAQVLAEIRERDHRDTTRADAPLVKAADAVEVDTSGLTPDAVIQRIVALARDC
ncbi:MAG TPA: (d)CMP kinase [Armatimonadota bacterium]